MMQGRASRIPEGGLIVVPLGEISSSREKWLLWPGTSPSLPLQTLLATPQTVLLPSPEPQASGWGRETCTLAPSSNRKGRRKRKTCFAPSGLRGSLMGRKPTAFAHQKLRGRVTPALLLGAWELVWALGCAPRPSPRRGLRSAPPRPGAGAVVLAPFASRSCFSWSQGDACPSLVKCPLSGSLQLFTLGGSHPLCFYFQLGSGSESGVNSPTQLPSYYCLLAFLKELSAAGFCCCENVTDRSSQTTGE